MPRTTTPPPTFEHPSETFENGVRISSERGHINHHHIPRPSSNPGVKIEEWKGARYFLITAERDAGVARDLFEDEIRAISPEARITVAHVHGKLGKFAFIGLQEISDVDLEAFYTQMDKKDLLGLLDMNGGLQPSAIDEFVSDRVNRPLLIDLEKHSRVRPVLTPLMDMIKAISKSQNWKALYDKQQGDQLQICEGEYGTVHITGIINTEVMTTLTQFLRQAGLMAETDFEWLREHRQIRIKYAALIRNQDALIDALQDCTQSLKRNSGNDRGPCQ